MVARVLEHDTATDLAVALSCADLGVVRCVHEATPADHTALATMLAEGDFVWAGLVYSVRDGSGPPGPIETFHVSELDRLVARLHEFGGAADEAR